jgi:hypothetical protein
MREVHRGLPSREFKRPASGVTDLRVCAKSGKLLTPRCNQGSVVLSFLSDSTPSEYCTYHNEGGGGDFGLDLDGYGGDDFPLWQGPTLDFDSLPSEAWFQEGGEGAYSGFDTLQGAAAGAAAGETPFQQPPPAGGLPQLYDSAPPPAPQAAPPGAPPPSAGGLPPYAGDSDVFQPPDGYNPFTD